MDDYTFILALIGSISGLIGLLWTAYQQNRLNVICRSCPYWIDAHEEEAPPGPGGKPV